MFFLLATSKGKLPAHPVRAGLAGHVPVAAAELLKMIGRVTPAPASRKGLTSFIHVW